MTDNMSSLYKETEYMDQLVTKDVRPSLHTVIEREDKSNVHNVKERNDESTACLEHHVSRCIIYR